MEKDKKTLLDSMLEDNSGGKSQSLEELLGMAETEDERNKRLLLNAAERGEQNAILAVAECYMYGKIGFPEEPLEAMFWLSQSTSDRAPLILTEYLRKDKKNLDLAEQGLELLFESDGNEKRMNLAYTFAMSLGTEFGRNQDIPRCLKWLKRADGHEDPGLMAMLFEWIYKNILKFPETYGEYCPEAAEYLESRAEQSEDRERIIRTLSQYYYDNPNDKEKVVYWVTKSSETGSAVAQYWLASAYLGKKDWGLGIDVSKAKHYIGLVEKNPNARDTTVKAAKRLRTYIKDNAEALGADKPAEYLNADLTKKRQEEERKKLHDIPQKVLNEADGTQMLEELKKAGSTVLRVPDGYTDIERRAFCYLNHPYIKEIKEIILPDTVCAIEDSAFEGCCSLTKLTLPKRLERLGPTIFKGSYFGFLKMTKKAKNTIQRVSIPANTKLQVASLGGIAGIECLHFEIGREELDWAIFCGLDQTCKIGEMHIPGSVKRLIKTDDWGQSVHIEKLYIPKHLKDEFSKIQKESIKIKISTIVHT